MPGLACPGGYLALIDDSSQGQVEFMVERTKRVPLGVYSDSESIYRSYWVPRDGERGPRERLGYRYDVEMEGLDNRILFKRGGHCSCVRRGESHSDVRWIIR